MPSLSCSVPTLSVGNVSVLSKHLALKTVIIIGEVIELLAQLIPQIFPKLPYSFISAVWQRGSSLTKPKSDQFLGDKCSFKAKLSYAELVGKLSANPCLEI